MILEVVLFLVVITSFFQGERGDPGNRGENGEPGERVRIKFVGTKL